MIEDTHREIARMTATTILKGALFSAWLDGLKEMQNESVKLSPAQGAVAAESFAALDEWVDIWIRRIERA